MARVVVRRSQSSLGRLRSLCCEYSIQLSLRVGTPAARPAPTLPMVVVHRPRSTTLMLLALVLMELAATLTLLLRYYY